MTLKSFEEIYSDWVSFGLLGRRRCNFCGILALGSGKEDFGCRIYLGCTLRCSTIGGCHAKECL